MKITGINYADFLHGKNVEKMQIKHFELIEILNKLTYYRKKSKKVYLKLFYCFAIAAIVVIVKKEVLINRL